MTARYLLPLCLMLAAVCSAQEAPGELRKVSGSPVDCVRNSLHLAHERLEESDRRYAASDPQGARVAAAASLDAARQAVDCALEVKRSQKSAEIELRKLSRRMAAIAQSVEAEERPHIEQLQADLEKQRDRLLQAMFGAAAAGHSTEKKP